jgi:hypothetical protein
MGGILHDPFRLQALSEVIGARGKHHEFDRVARLTARSLQVPTSLITLIGATDQYFGGICGGSEEMTTSRGGPHENSLCRHTVAQGVLVSITHASADPAFRDNPIVKANGIEAYLGIPLTNSDGHIFGTICGIDYKPRDWTVEEIDVLRDFAAVATGQLEAIALHERMRVAMDVALHDLKTPLSGLTMASALVHERRGSIPPELHPLLEVVRSSTEAAKKLVDTLGNSQGCEEISYCGDGVDLCRSILKRLAPSAEAKSIRVEFVHEGRGGLAASVLAIGQALENLVSAHMEARSP